MPIDRGAFSLLLAVLVLALPACASDGDMLSERIRHFIASSQILPADYRKHINISVTADSAGISVYRDPDANNNDCKIDAILIADKVLEADAAVKLVRVAFYDLTEEDKFWEASVPTSAVSEYARGNIGRDDILRAVKLSEHQSNNLAKNYGALSYKQMVEGLGLVEGPLRDARAVALIRLDKLQPGSGGVLPLRSQFLHVEDLARRGEESQVRRALKDLTAALQKLGGANQRISQLDELRREPASVNENLNRVE